MDFSWAEQYPEVYKVCNMFQLSEVSLPITYCYTPLRAYIQDGPQCGLVALAMCLDNPVKETIDKLLESARNHGFSFNGEMFSAQNMAELAKENLDRKAIVSVHRGILNDQKLINHLMGGGLMLVPYDTDRNNAPGLYQGHKAHWAVISGVVQTKNGYYVLARHGKSKNVGVWSLDRISDSNKQLLEFSPDQKLQHLQYKLPEGGISGPLGLNERSILIKFQNDS